MNPFQNKTPRCQHCLAQTQHQEPDDWIDCWCSQCKQCGRWTRQTQSEKEDQE